MAKLSYINLGCGYTYNDEWTNVDFISTGPGVIGHNLLKGVPFPDNTFDVAYHSHVLEHFLKKDAEKFISECHRILRKDGIIRVAIPDLEQIARNYIKYLEASLQGVPGAEEKYNWTMLELFDQTVRTKGGGGMVEYIRDVSHNNDDFLIERNGNETRLLIQNIRQAKPQNSSNPGFRQKLKNRLIQLLLKDDTRALEIGRFRLGGEIHQWMYDRFSLGELLRKSGFTDIRVVKADESSIKDWNSFGLDIIDGKVRKPDSLFMEARKV